MFISANWFSPPPILFFSLEQVLSFCIGNKTKLYFVFCLDQAMLYRACTSACGSDAIPTWWDRGLPGLLMETGLPENKIGSLSHSQANSLVFL